MTSPSTPTGPGPLAPTMEPRVTDETAEALDRLWHLVLLDVDMHSYGYVVEMLGDIFGYGTEKAFALARLVDSEKRVILETGDREQCEGHQQRVHAYGADPRIPQCQGSMTAILEQAP